MLAVERSRISDELPLTTEVVCLEMEEMGDEESREDDCSSDSQILCFGCVMFVCSYVYVACSVLGFFTSTHLKAESRLDFMAVSADVIAIDLSSAVFVVTGFVGSQIIESQAPDTIVPYLKYATVYVLIDSWIATFISCIFGSLFNLAELDFHVQDIAITCLEGFTGLQVLDWSQAANSWHSLNSPIWFLHCLLYAVISIPFAQNGIEKVTRLFPLYAHYFVLVNSLLPVAVISFFALYHSKSNVFYTNVTNIGYRLLECNLGIAVFYQVKRLDMLTLRCLELLSFCYREIVCIFCMIWWTHLGLTVDPSVDSCIRLYHFSPCIKWHNEFLMRGCLIGVTFIAVIGLAKKNIIISDVYVQHLKTIPTVISMCYPASYVLSLLLQINFTRSLMLENTPLIVFCIPFVLHVIANVWISSHKEFCVDYLLAKFDGLIVRARKIIMFNNN